MAKRRTDTAASGKPPGSPLWAKFLGIALLSVFMFTVGVFVGRGTAPVQFDVADLNARLKSLRDKAFKEDVQRFGVETDAPGDGHTLKYREVLRKPEDPAAPPEKPPAAPTARKPSQAPKTPSADEGSPARTDNDRQHYVLQVASMKDAAAAAAMVEDLKKQGYPAYRESIEIPEKGLWYRVRIGGYPDRAAVEKLQAGLGGMASASMIVQTSGD